MQPLLNCRVGPQHFASWEKILTQRYAPFFLTDESRHLLPPHIVQYTRAEMGDDFVDLPLDARDAYAIYRVERSAGWCALLDAATLASMDAQMRHALFCEQEQLGRGQVYALADAQRLCADEPQALDQLEQWSFTTAEGAFIVLDHMVWQSFGAMLRERWLRWFVAREQDDCMSPTITEQEWARMLNGFWMRQLAGTFAIRSGPNCFATTLAALTPANKGIKERWLHQGPFERTLVAIGLQPENFPADLETVPAGAVLVWQDAQKRMQHACYVCAPGLALNKNSQSWFVPRQIAPLKRIMDDWREDGLTIKMYLPK